MTRSRRHQPVLGPWPLNGDGSACVALSNTPVMARVSPEDLEPVTRQGRWKLGTDGYVYHYYPRALRGKYRAVAVSLHRFVARARAGELIDHRHGNPLDCTRPNLRRASPSGNAANRTRLLPAKSCPQFRGVTWNKHVGKWQAAVKHLGRCLHLGVFTDPADAARAYDAKARDLWGAFARLNFPLPGEAPAVLARAA